jgi:hypothetical protein
MADIAIGRPQTQLIEKKYNISTAEVTGSADGKAISLKGIRISVAGPRMVSRKKQH